MANVSLAISPLSRNDIPIIANLLERSFDYFIDHYSSYFYEYLKSLRTVAGLGLTAALVDRDLLCIYQRYLKQLLAHKEGNFRESVGAKTSIAQCLSEMI